jgi:hypothetical protein
MQIARTLVTVVWCGGLVLGFLTTDVAAGPTFCSQAPCAEVAS